MCSVSPDFLCTPLCTSCKTGARIEGSPSDLAARNRLCTRKHAFDLLGEAPLWFSGASPAPVEALPGAFGFCNENHIASLAAVELCAQVSFGASYWYPSTNLLAKEEDHSQRLIPVST